MLQPVSPTWLCGDVPPLYSTVPPAKAAPTAGAVPEGVPKFPSPFQTTTTPLPDAFVVNARSIRDASAGTAANAWGGLIWLSNSKTFSTAMCCMLYAAESAAVAGGGTPLAHVRRVSNTIPLVKT